MDVEAEIVDLQDILLVFDTEMLHLQHALTRRLGLLVDVEVYHAAHHFVGHFLRGGIGDVDCVDKLAAPDDHAAVGDLLDLLELVGNEDDGLAPCDKRTHDRDQIFDLLRHQNGRRLIKNENICVAVEHFQDLCALLHADGDLVSAGVRINGQTVALTELLHTADGLLHVELQAVARLGAEHDVFRNREVVDQLEMLVHHADAEAIGLAGVADVDRLAVDEDLTGVRLVDAHDDIHQSRLARTVFAEQGEDLALMQLEGNIVVGAQAREVLDDPAHLQNNLVVHTFAPLRRVYGSTAQLRLRASTDLFRQFCGLKRLKYIQYSCTFQTLP